jgi:small multidrug resistance pump
MPYLMLFLSGTCSALASVLLRVAGQMGTTPVQGLMNLLTMPNLLRLGAILAYGAGFVLYALALKRVELNIAYPLMVGIAILEIFGYGLLGGETVSARSAIGALLIMSGIFLIYSK